MSEISITEERKAVHDFSIPYFNSGMGVLPVLMHRLIQQEHQGMPKVGVQQGTTGATYRD